MENKLTIPLDRTDASVTILGCAKAVAQDSEEVLFDDEMKNAEPQSPHVVVMSSLQDYSVRLANAGLKVSPSSCTSRCSIHEILEPIDELTIDLGATVSHRAPGAQRALTSPGTAGAVRRAPRPLPVWSAELPYHPTSEG